MNNHICVVSHRRSGTHLVIDTITSNFSSFRKSPHVRYLTLDHLKSDNGVTITNPRKLNKFLQEYSCVLKTHSHGNVSLFFSESEESCINLVREVLTLSQIIYVWRNPLDVMLSLYHYETAACHNRNMHIDLSKYIRQDNSFDADTCPRMSRPAYWGYHVATWFLSGRDIIMVNFEDLLDQYSDLIRKLARSLQVASSDRVVDARRANMSSFPSLCSRMLTRVGGSRLCRRRNTSVLFRRGIKGEGRKAMSEDDHAWIHEQIVLGAELAGLDGKIFIKHLLAKHCKQDKTNGYNTKI